MFLSDNYFYFRLLLAICGFAMLRCTQSKSENMLAFYVTVSLCYIDALLLAKWTLLFQLCIIILARASQIPDTMKTYGYARCELVNQADT